MEQILAKIEKIVGKDSMETFYNKFKENLKSTPKENENKKFHFEIKGGEGEPEGIGLSITSINKDSYANYIKEEKDYMKDALTVLTIAVGAKDASAAELLKGTFEQFKPMIDEIPVIKPYLEQKKLEYFLRVEGTKAYVDVIVKDEMAFKKLQEIGVDFSEYQSFNFKVKTGLKCDGIFDMKLEEIIEKFLTLIVGVDASTTNVKFLITALIKTLEGMDLKEEKQQKRLRKLKIWLGSVLTFVNFGLNVQYDPKEGTKTIFTTKKMEEKGSEITEAIEGGKAMLEGFGGENAKAMLEGFGVYETAKAVNIDCLTISLLSTQFKNGFAFNLCLPGITNFVNSKFLSA